MTRLQNILAATTLDELYRWVPKPVNCSGACWDSCGPIGYSKEEGERLEAAGHRPPNAHEQRRQLMCTALTTDHRCKVYEARPMVCRIWGVSDVMPCPHDGNNGEKCWTAFPLNQEESSALMRRAMELGGRITEQVQKYQLKTNDLIEIISRGRKEWGV